MWGLLQGEAAFFKTVQYSGDGVAISSKDIGVVRTMKSPDIGIS